MLKFLNPLTNFSSLTVYSRLCSNECLASKGANLFIEAMTTGPYDEGNLMQTNGVLVFHKLVSVILQGECCSPLCTPLYTLIKGARKKYDCFHHKLCMVDLASMITWRPGVPIYLLKQWRLAIWWRQCVNQLKIMSMNSSCVAYERVSYKNKKKRDVS